MTTPKKKNTLPYPPPWQDSVTLAEHLCISPSTVPEWVEQGIIPPPREVGGKVMWKWSEVDEKLTVGKASIDAEAERIRNGTRAAAAETRRH
jgi:predicted site-specific integrase-resolvase